MLPLSKDELRQITLQIAETEAAKETFREKLKELNAWIFDREARKLATSSYARSISSEDTYQIFTRLTDRWFSDEEAEIKKLKLKWNRLLNPKDFQNVKNFDIEEVKTKMPVQDLMDSKPVRCSGDRINFVCPFHTEKTASFVVFKKTNTFHCFGYQAHGSLIDFVMRRNGFNFIEACKHILALSMSSGE